METVITTCVMAILYWLVFVPAGFLYRLCTKHSARAAINKKAGSYWKSVPPAPIDFDVMF